MFNHEPNGYQCPFCFVLDGGETAANTQRDIVLRTELAVALISPRWWPNNRGHVVVVPTAHYESLYDLPNQYGHAVHDVVRQIAVAMRHAYACDGISTRQHNEPAGNQDVWHLHVHVFPRYAGDNLYKTNPYKELVSSEQRWLYADKLRSYLG